MRSTVGFGIAYILLGHTGLWFIMFGTDNSVRIFGLPIHYFIAIILGSLGVLILSIIWCRYANQLEDEIEAENALVSGATSNRAVQADGLSNSGEVSK